MAADIANQTWINVEQGEPVKEHTLAGVDVAMRWEPGSAKDVLAGGEPRERSEGDEPKLSMLERIERIEHLLEQLLVEKEAEERAEGRERQPNS